MSVKVLVISHNDGSQITIPACVPEMTIGEIKHALIAKKRMPRSSTVFDNIVFYDSNNRVVLDNSHVGEWMKSNPADPSDIPIAVFCYRIAKKSISGTPIKASATYGTMDPSLHSSSDSGAPLPAPALEQIPTQSTGTLSSRMRTSFSDRQPRLPQACLVCSDPTLDRCGACARPTCAECANETFSRRLSAVQMFLYQNTRKDGAHRSHSRPHDVLFEENENESESIQEHLHDQEPQHDDTYTEDDTQRLIPGARQVSSPISHDRLDSLQINSSSASNQQKRKGSSTSSQTGFAFFLCPRCKEQRVRRANRKSIKYFAIILGIVLGIVLLVTIISSSRRP